MFEHCCRYANVRLLFTMAVQFIRTPQSGQGKVVDELAGDRLASTTALTKSLSAAVASFFADIFTCYRQQLR